MNIIQFFATSAYAVTTPWNGDTGLNKAAGVGTTEGLLFKGDIAVVIGMAIQAGLALIGVIFLVLIVYAGILWMTSQGEEKKVTNARGYIFHSILGLIIVMAASAITQYFINSLGRAALQ